MPDTIDSARSLIEARLRELDAEAERLRRALGSLGETRPSKRRGRSRRGAARRKATRRAPRGQRREQFLAALQQSPGARVTEIAKELGISPNQAHTLARRLRKDRLIHRSGKGYRLAPKAGS